MCPASVYIGRAFLPAPARLNHCPINHCGLTRSWEALGWGGEIAEERVGPACVSGRQDFDQTVSCLCFIPSRGCGPPRARVQGSVPFSCVPSSPCAHLSSRCKSCNAWGGCWKPVVTPRPCPLALLRVGGLTSAPSSPDPVQVIVSGQKVFADVTQLEICWGGRPGSSRWVLNPMADVLIRESRGRFAGEGVGGGRVGHSRGWRGKATTGNTRTPPGAGREGESFLL